MDGVDALARAIRWTPPPCLPPTPCLGNVCQCSPASFAAPVDAALPALTAATAGQLRIFFFDGRFYVDLIEQVGKYYIIVSRFAVIVDARERKSTILGHVHIGAWTLYDAARHNLA